MVQCGQCGEEVREDSDKAGARCPSCHEPLYDRPGGPRPASETDPRDQRGTCVIHPDNAAIGTCKRCGNFLCVVCRTQWEGVPLCLRCVERVLQSREATPQELRTHRRQAVTSVWLGLGAWIAALCSGVLGLAAASGSNDQQGAASSIIMGVLGAVGSMSLSTVGLGQAAAAVRARGDRLILASCGLVLNAAQLGVVVGLVLLSLFRH